MYHFSCYREFYSLRLDTSVLKCPVCASTAHAYDARAMYRFSRCRRRPGRRQSRVVTHANLRTDALLACLFKLLINVAIQAALSSHSLVRLLRCMTNTYLTTVV